jgi:hypothetical protein
MTATKSPYPHYLGVCAIFRNEAQWLREWIEFHRLVGVTRFLLYDNGSTDDYWSVLRSCAPACITVIDWPDDGELVRRIGWVRATQMPAYLDGMRRMTGECTWLAVMDTDEFLVPVRDRDMPTFLRPFESFGGVVLNWQCFGTSGVRRLPAGKLMIECLSRRGPRDSKYNRRVKSIVRPERVAPVPHLHVFEYRGGWYAVNPDGERYGRLDEAICARVDSARIHHYMNRTLEYFEQEKIGKKEHMSGLVLSRDDVRVRRERFNDVEDRTILRFVPELRANLFPGSGGVSSRTGDIVAHENELL